MGEQTTRCPPRCCTQVVVHRLGIGLALFCLAYVLGGGVWVEHVEGIVPPLHNRPCVPPLASQVHADTPLQNNPEGHMVVGSHTRNNDNTATARTRRKAVQCLPRRTGHGTATQPSTGTWAAGIVVHTCSTHLLYKPVVQQPTHPLPHRPIINGGGLTGVVYRNHVLPGTSQPNGCL